MATVIHTQKFGGSGDKTLSMLYSQSVSNSGGGHWMYTATEKIQVCVSAILGSTTCSTGTSVWARLNKSGTVSNISNGQIVELDIGDQVGFYAQSVNNMPYGNTVVFTVVGLV